MNKSTMTASITLPVRPLEQQEMVQNVVDSLKRRLANDEFGLWQFELGLDLVRAFYLSTAIQTPRNNNPNRFLEAAIMIRIRLDNRPDGVTADVVRALEQLETNLGSEKRTKEIDDSISKSIVTILNN